MAGFGGFGAIRLASLPDGIGCRRFLVPCLQIATGYAYLQISISRSLLAESVAMLTNEKARSPFGLCWNCGSPRKHTTADDTAPDEELARRAGQAGDDESFAELFADTV